MFLCPPAPPIHLLTSHLPHSPVAFPRMQSLLSPPTPTRNAPSHALGRAALPHAHYHPFALVYSTSNDHSALTVMSIPEFNMSWFDDGRVQSDHCSFFWNTVVINLDVTRRLHAHFNSMFIFSRYCFPVCFSVGSTISVSYTLSCEDAPQLSWECALEIRKVRTIRS